MKLTKYILPLIILMLISTVNVSGQRFLYEGNKYFDRNLFEDAIPFYLKEIEKGKKYKYKMQARKKLATCYRLTGSFLEASEVQAKILQASFRGEKPQATLDLAFALKNSAQYDEAAEEFRNYMQLKPDDQMGEIYLQSCINSQIWIDEVQQYAVRNFDGINSVNPEFSPVFYENGLVFTTSRENSTKKFINLSETITVHRTDLYYADLSSEDVVPIDNSQFEALNTFLHEGTSTFNRKFDEVYFTRTIVGETNRKKNTLLNSLQVFYSKKDDEGNWSEPVSAFEFNNVSYSIGQPSLTRDGKRIFYISDKSNGFGKTDIYYSDLIGESTWTSPVNLGPTINTFGFELFPYAPSKDTLYFSSATLPGMGKLDIFMSTYKDGEWSVPVNLKPPINSIGDDFGIVMNKDQTMGLFSSDRFDGHGQDDIYAFSKEVPVDVIMEGHTLRIPNNTFFTNIKYKISEEGGSSENLIDTRDGYYVFPIKEDKSYKISLRKGGFFFDAIDLRLIPDESSQSYKIQLNSGRSEINLSGQLVDAFLPNQRSLMDTLVTDSITEYISEIEASTLGLPSVRIDLLEEQSIIENARTSDEGEYEFNYELEAGLFYEVKPNINDIMDYRFEEEMIQEQLAQSKESSEGSGAEDSEDAETNSDTESAEAGGTDTQGTESTEGTETQGTESTEGTETQGTQGTERTEGTESPDTQGTERTEGTESTDLNNTENNLNNTTSANQTIGTTNNQGTTQTGTTSNNQAGTTANTQSGTNTNTQTGNTENNQTGTATNNQTGNTGNTQTGTTANNQTGTTANNQTGTTANNTGTNYNQANTQTGTTANNQTGTTSNNQTGTTANNTGTNYNQANTQTGTTANNQTGTTSNNPTGTTANNTGTNYNQGFTQTGTTANNQTGTTANNTGTNYNQGVTQTGTTANNQTGTTSNNQTGTISNNQTGTASNNQTGTTANNTGTNYNQANTQTGTTANNQTGTTSNKQTGTTANNTGTNYNQANTQTGTTANKQTSTTASNTGTNYYQGNNQTGTTTNNKGTNYNQGNTQTGTTAYNQTGTTSNNKTGTTSNNQTGTTSNNQTGTTTNNTGTNYNQGNAHTGSSANTFQANPVQEVQNRTTPNNTTTSITYAPSSGQSTTSNQNNTAYQGNATNQSGTRNQGTTSTQTGATNQTSSSYVAPPGEKFTYEAVLTSGEDNQPITDADVKLYSGTKMQDKTVTDNSGKFDFEMETQKDYRVIAEKKGYFQADYDVNTSNPNIAKANKISVNMEPISVNRKVEIENILFDFNKFDLRRESVFELDRLSDFLELNPEIHILLNAHTDNRGNYYTNLLLSYKRAISSKKYLILNGIDKDRIIVLGYGETFPNIAAASAEWEHEVNRRVEFKILDSDRTGYGILYNTEPGDKTSVFTIFADCPYSSSNRFAKGDPLPRGKYYRILLRKSKQKLPYDAFDGIFPVIEQFNTQSREYSYYAGLFYNEKEAIDAGNMLSSYGFKPLEIPMTTSTKDPEEYIPVSTGTSSSSRTAGAKYNAIPGSSYSNATFTIQTGAFRNELKSSAITELQKIAGSHGLYTFRKNDFNVYTIGGFTSYDDAVNTRARLINGGLNKTSFIIAHKAGVRVSIEDAKAINRNQVQQNNASVSLFYCVQIAASRKEVSSSQLTSFKKIAGQNQVKKFIHNNYHIYTIGQCETPEEANSLRIELVRRGAKSNVFVTAIHNGKRITNKEAERLRMP